MSDELVSVVIPAMSGGGSLQGAASRLDSRWGILVGLRDRAPGRQHRLWTSFVRAAQAR